MKHTKPSGQQTSDQPERDAKTHEVLREPMAVLAEERPGQPRSELDPVIANVLHKREADDASREQAVHRKDRSAADRDERCDDRSIK